MTRWLDITDRDYWQGPWPWPEHHSDSRKCVGQDWERRGHDCTWRTLCLKLRLTVTLGVCCPWPGGRDRDRDRCTWSTVTCEVWGPWPLTGTTTVTLGVCRVWPVGQWPLTGTTTVTLGVCEVWPGYDRDLAVTHGVCWPWPVVGAGHDLGLYFRTLVTRETWDWEINFVSLTLSTMVTFDK